jgi:endonuclease VIII
MPEGPSVRLAVDRLRAALQGRRIIRFSSTYKKARTEDWTTKIEGSTVVAARSHGKNMFLDFDSGWTLYTHFLMWGSWHVYRQDEPWAKEARKARVELHTTTHVAVLFSAPVCELIHRDDLVTHQSSETGPDLLSDAFDAAEARRRFLAPEHATREVGELIMDQTVMAGIGNILKSEILFEVGIHPQRLPATLTDAEWERFVAAARALMQRSYELGTFDGAFLPAGVEVEPSRYGYVYRRRTYPCLRCGTPIRMVRQGARQRMTYYCPACQPYVGERNPDLLPDRPRRRSARSPSVTAPGD